MPRRLILLLAAALIALVLSASASIATAGTTRANPENGVRAFNQAALTRTRPANPESACSRPGSIASTAGMTAGFCVAAEDGGQLLLGPGTTIGDHVAGQLANRGWTERLVQSTIDDPASTVATRDIRNLPGGGRMDDPATGYISRRGGYVVQNNRTGDVVQVSNRTDPGWLAPWDR